MLLWGRVALTTDPVTSPTHIELMNSFSINSVYSRKPCRVTVTIPWSLKQTLDQRSSQEGRSLSNLIAYLLEKSISSMTIE